jgi:hypothetical protein
MIPNSSNPKQQLSSDNVVLLTARAELQKCAYREVREVQCELTNGVLKLVGSVPSYFHKQMAQAFVLRQLGTLPIIDNQLRVVDEPQALFVNLGNAR